MQDIEIINIFKNFLPFLATLCGPGCEMVLHDINFPEKSIIAIENNNNTGREIGDGFTDFAKKIIDERLYEGKNYIADYFAHTNGIHFRSFTYFIKNDGRLIAFLCINKNIGPVKDAINALNSLLSTFNMELEPSNDIVEKLDTNVEEMMKTIITEEVNRNGISPRRLSKEEKIEIVHRLNEQGILKTRGAIKEISAQLGVSEPTIYRYLKSEKK